MHYRHNSAQYCKIDLATGKLYCHSRGMNAYPYPAVVLAGGRAYRLGGGDKVLLPLAGSSLLTRITGRLSPQTGAIALNANGDPARFAEYGLTVLPDSLNDRPGPLAGILAALDWASDIGSNGVITVAGDTPFLPNDLVARLSEQAGKTGLAIAASADDSSMRLHPVNGLWPVHLREPLRLFLSNGHRDVQNFTSLHDAQTVIWQITSFDPFFNINTPEDLRLAEQLAAL